MKDKEIFDGFTSIVKKGKGHESYFLAESIVGNSIREPSGEKKENAMNGTIIKTTHDIFKKLVKCIDKKNDPSSDETQHLIKLHHAFIDKFQRATKEVYIAMAQLYREHPEFRKQLDPFHPKLAEYMSEAMKIFAIAELA